MIKVIRAANYRRMRWKNGRGTTLELIRRPEEASLPLEQLHWRVSIAAITENGQFSTFDGYDRSIALINGEGVILHVENNKTVELFTSSAPYRFSGDSYTYAELVKSGVKDFNVISSRKYFVHELFRMRADCTEKSVTNKVGGAVFIYANRGAALVRNENHEPVRIEENESAVVEESQVDEEIQVSTTEKNADVLVARFVPVL